MLLQDFIRLDEKADEQAMEEDDASRIKLEEKTIIIVKFICAVLFHFKFETEIRNGLAMMKYVGLHPDHFTNKINAYMMGLVNMLVIVLVEFINIWNLSNIKQGGTYTLMFDFIALGIIAEFDDYFIEIYRYSNINYLISELEPFKFVNTAMPKRKLPNYEEERMERLMLKIRDSLKEFRDHCSEKNTRNLPKLTEENVSDLSYTSACKHACLKTCCSGRPSRNWHAKAQEILSKAIIQIVMLL